MNYIYKKKIFIICLIIIYLIINKVTFKNTPHYEMYDLDSKIFKLA